MPAARSCSNQRQLPDSYGYLIHPLLKSERREQETRRSSTPGHSRTILSIPEGSSNVPSLLSHKKAWTSLQNWREFSFSCTRFNASKPSTCHISDNYGYWEAVQRVPPPLRYGKPWVSLQNWSEFSCCARFSGGTR